MRGEMICLNCRAAGHYVTYCYQVVLIPWSTIIVSEMSKDVLASQAERFMYEGRS